MRCDKDTSGEWYISIHAPVWARLLACYRSAWRVLIRAPVQGATMTVLYIEANLPLVLIRAPVQGATLGKRTRSLFEQPF